MAECVVTCKRCGAKETVQASQCRKKYCDDCRIIVNKEAGHKSSRKATAKKREMSATRPKTMPEKAADSTCSREDCYYYSVSTNTCDYRLIRGVGRDCGAEKCNKYTKRDKRRSGADSIISHDWFNWNN